MNKYINKFIKNPINSELLNTFIKDNLVDKIIELILGNYMSIKKLFILLMLLVELDLSHLPIFL